MNKVAGKSPDASRRAVTQNEIKRVKPEPSRDSDSETCGQQVDVLLCG